WMLACEEKRRPLSTFLLAVGLCGAVASHYYAGLVLIPLAAGEVARTLVRRRVDLAVWLAFGGALIPVIGFARTILTARAYGAHFWAHPHLSGFVGWYPVTLGYSIFLPLAAYVVAVLFRIPVTRSLSASGSRSSGWYSVTIFSLALLPVFG